jgi:hypothetical protein
VTTDQAAGRTRKASGWSFSPTGSRTLVSFDGTVTLDVRAALALVVQRTEVVNA